MEIASVIVPVVTLLALGIAAAVLSRVLQINPIVGYLALGLVLSATDPALLYARGVVHVMADLGVVFLLFDIGLHFSIAHIRREAKDIFAFGPVQVVAAAAIVGMTAWLLGVPSVGALYAGGALSLSSTAIITGIIAERRQQNCPVALTATAISVFQDVAGILLLILAGSGSGGSPLPLLAATIGKAAIAVAASIAAGRYLVRPFYTLLARHGGEEVFTATALLIALASAGAAFGIGLSLTLGAFLGGMMVAESPFRASIRSEIGPFRGLFVSFFFISVGGSLNLAELRSAWPGIVLLAAAIVVLKSIGNIVASLSFRWSIPGSVQLGVLLAGGSEFAFVIFGTPAVRDAIGPGRISDLIAAVALTLAITPVLAQAGRDLAGRLRRSRASSAPHELVPVGRTNPVLIIGMGDIGRTIANGLSRFDIGYDAIERNGARLRNAVADGYNAFHGDASDARIWRSMDLAERRWSIMTAATPEAAGDWLPASQALFPDVARLWVAATEEQQRDIASRGVEVVVSRDLPRGIEAAQLVLLASGIPECSVEAWIETQRPRPEVTIKVATQALT